MVEKAPDISGTTSMWNTILPRDPLAPATDEDKRNWKGFCEVESEPALFNVMLKRFGVDGVKVQEVVSLDEEMLSFLPRPVYGLIFLFKWIEEDADRQEQSCPEQIWFANQTINNACASVALLNIVNNVPEIELGESLRAFKDFTMSFSPALRGDAIKNFNFVREIHNYFARKMDMLNIDLFLKNEATSRGKSKTGNLREVESEAGFHFIAFMPIENKLWKLDGLERQPMCLGPVQGDWVVQAKPDIEARMAQYEEDHIEFAILSLVRDPLLNLVPALASNVKTVLTLTSRLDEIKPDWQQFTPPSSNDQDTEKDSHIVAADAAYALEQRNIDEAPLMTAETVSIIASNNATEMLKLRQKLITEQIGLKMDVKEELQAVQADEMRATSRSLDSGARLQKFSRMVKIRENNEA